MNQRRSQGDRKPCSKRGFAGKKSALASIGRLHHTVHVYECDGCRKWHVAKRDRRRSDRVNAKAIPLPNPAP